MNKNKYDEKLKKQVFDLICSKDQVLSFIQRRFPNPDLWMNGNCAWFAYILCERFPALEVYLLPVRNHFIAGNGHLFFDWSGCYELEQLSEEPIKWTTLCEADDLWTARLVRDCIL